MRPRRKRCKPTGRAASVGTGLASPSSCQLGWPRFYDETLRFHPPRRFVRHTLFAASKLTWFLQEECGDYLQSLLQATGTRSLERVRSLRTVKTDPAQHSSLRPVQRMRSCSPLLTSPARVSPRPFREESPGGLLGVSFSLGRTSSSSEVSKHLKQKKVYRW